MSFGEVILATEKSLVIQSLIPPPPCTVPVYMPVVVHLNMLIPALAGHVTADPRVFYQCAVSVYYKGHVESDTRLY